MPASHLTAFAKLHTDTNSARWSPLTRHRAPHKPFLLLSIMDLVAQGLIIEPFILPSQELVETFNGYWSLVMPPTRRGLPSYPLYHLRSEPFWHLVPHPGQTDRPGRTISSMAKFGEYYAGARIDETLFAAMVDPVQRERLRKVLVETYFDPAVQAAVAEQGVVNLAAYEYAAALTRGVNETVAPAPGLAAEASRKVRDQGFRKAIVTLYDHRCALCGIRMLTADGHTIVEAAHIVPWSKSQDDHPTNGLCLCRLCHWSFDEGLMGVGKKYEVLVSKRVRVDQNIPGHMLTLLDRPIFKPDKETFWPSQSNLSKHRNSTFI